MALFEQRLSENLGLLNEVIDEAALVNAEDEPDVICTYFKNRKILDPPSKTISLRGKISHAVSRTPVRNVEVRTGNFISYSTSKGNFRFPMLEPGTHTLILSKPGFITQQITVIIAGPEEPLVISVSLVPIANLENHTISN